MYHCTVGALLRISDGKDDDVFWGVLWEAMEYNWHPLR